MIRVNLKQSIAVVYSLPGCWLASSYITPEYFIITPDGSCKKYSGGFSDNYLDQNGEWKKFSRQVNPDYEGMYVEPRTIISRHLGFKDNEYGFVFENKKEKTTKALNIPGFFIDDLMWEGQNDSRIYSEYSMDGLTVLIYQYVQSNLIILDNPVLQ